MGGVVKSVVRGVGRALGFSAPRLPAPPDPAPAVELEEEAENESRRRRALFETEGGAAGEELEAGGVRSRNTLLGN